MKNVYIYGASGHGKVIKEIIDACGDRVVAFIDDNPSLSEHMGIPVIHSADLCQEIVIGIGANHIRKMISERLDVEFPVYIHPSAVVSPSAKIGAGTVIMAGAIVNAEAVVGKHCIINTGATIDHDVVIGDYVHVAPGVNISGGVYVEDGTWIGVGSCIIQCLTIGQWNMIGAGSVVVENIPEDHVVAYGNPCKVVRNY